MNISISEKYGYRIVYDDRTRKFLVLDADGTELAQAPTQDEAEAKAKSLSKQDFKRINILRIPDDGEIVTGQLTSLNKDDNSAWVSMDKGERAYGGGRQKVSLRYDRGYYVETENNLKIADEIRRKRAVITQTLEEIKSLKEKLESAINLNYFGLEDRR